MKKRSAMFIVSALALVLGASFLARVARAGMRLPAANALLFDKSGRGHAAQVHAVFIELSGNNDVSTTTLYLVNSSVTETLYLDQVDALGVGGLSNLLASDTAVNGLAIAPLGTVELTVDATNFPGLQPQVDRNTPGLASVLVTWSGPRDALQLESSVLLELPGSLYSRTVSTFEGHDVTK